mgnify:CR=1 FL=1|tara:strand:+ start:1790 stop:2194 length:405 start_codon:yes stop_codon:yes gene_type:complete
MELPKVNIAVIGVVCSSLGGMVWYASEQASIIANLQETVAVLTAENSATERVNLQRDVQQNTENINEITDILAEIYEDLEDTENELWEEIDVVWEDLGGMASHMMEIIKVQSRVKTLEGTLEYLIRSPVHNDAR